MREMVSICHQFAQKGSFLENWYKGAAWANVEPVQIWGGYLFKCSRKFFADVWALYLPGFLLQS